METNSLVQSVVQFVKEQPPVPPDPPAPDPVPGGGGTEVDYLSALTGDSLSMIIAAIIALAVVSLVIFAIVKRKNFAFSNLGKHVASYNPLKNTKVLFAIAIALVAIIGICVSVFKVGSANAAQCNGNPEATTPAIITAIVSEENGIVFQNLDGENTSYVTNSSTEKQNYTYTKIETNQQGLEDVV